MDPRCSESSSHVRHIRAAAMAIGLSGVVMSGCHDAATAPRSHGAKSVVVQWNEAALQAIRRTHPGPPMVARALAVAHTATYNAWAAYDAHAVATRSGGTLRRPPNERTEANKERAVSFAAYRALVDLFPTEQAVFDSAMRQLGFDPSDRSTDVTTAAGVGNTAAAAVLA